MDDRFGDGESSIFRTAVLSWFSRKLVNQVNCRNCAILSTFKPAEVGQLMCDPASADPVISGVSNLSA